MIYFPLSECDARLIEAAATQAPFGKGTETVRDAFKINTDKFSFKTPLGPILSESIPLLRERPVV